MIQRVRHLGQPHPRPVAVHPVGQHPRRRRHPLSRLTRHHQRASPPAPVAPGATATEIRPLLQHHMRIRATDAERRHPGPPRTRALRPRCDIGGNNQPRRRRINGRIPPREMQIRRNLPALEHQHRLDEPGHPGRGLQMTQIRFHRPQRARGVPAAIGGCQRLELDRITQHRAGAVGLDVVHGVGRHPTGAQRVGDHVALRQHIRRGQTRWSGRPG